MFVSHYIDLTDEYWDCDCPGDDYIRPINQKFCTKCGAFEEDQPSSRIDEVLIYFENHFPKGFSRLLKTFL